MEARPLGNTGALLRAARLLALGLLPASPWGPEPQPTQQPGVRLGVSSYQ